MISLPFVKFYEHNSVQLHIWEIEYMSIWEDEDDLLITHIMPVGRMRMKLRWLHWENNNTENNYVKYSYFKSYNCYQPMNFPLLPQMSEVMGEMVCSPHKHFGTSYWWTDKYLYLAKAFHTILTESISISFPSPSEVDKPVQWHWYSLKCRELNEPINSLFLLSRCGKWHSLNTPSCIPCYALSSYYVHLITTPKSRGLLPRWERDEEIKKNILLRRVELQSYQGIIALADLQGMRRM